MELTLTILLIVTMIAFLAPSYVRLGKKGERVIAISNGRSLLRKLQEFHEDFGSFPDRETGRKLSEFAGHRLDLSGNTANDYFRQLIDSGIATSEEPFYAVTSYTRKPDNNMNGKDALKAGEVGFGYIMNGDRAIGSDDPTWIIAVTPLLGSSTKGEFEADPLDGVAYVVHLDHSVTSHTIRNDRKVEIGNGRSLLDLGEGTIWGSRITPVISPPMTGR